MNGLNTTYEKQLLFQCIILTVLLFFLLTFFFVFENTTSNFIILFTFVAGVIYVYTNQTYNALDENNTVILYQLNVVQSVIYDFVDYRLRLISNDNTKNSLKSINIHRLYNEAELDSLYLDSQIINFFYNNVFLSDLNKEAYYNLVVLTNSILRVEKEVRNQLPNNTQQQIQVAVDFYKDALNTLSSFVFTRKALRNISLNEITQEYRNLMKRHIHELENSNNQYINKNGLNSSTMLDIFTKLKYDPYTLDDRFSHFN